MSNSPRTSARVPSVLAALCAGLLATLGVQAQTLTIATGEYPPWSSKKLVNGGFVNDIVTRAFKQEGIQVKYDYLPWKRALVGTKRGNYDATSFWFHSKARERNFYESDPVMQSKTVFFHLKSKHIPNWKTFADLSSYSIGVTRSFTYTKAFWKAGKAHKLHLDVTGSESHNMKKLLHGRIDLFPTGALTGWALANSLDPAAKSKLATLSKPLVVTKGFLLFPKKKSDSAKLMAEFNKGLKALKADGTIKKLKQKLRNGGYKH